MERGEQGFIKLIILIIIAVIILSVLRVDIRAMFGSQMMRDNFGFVWESVKLVWNGYLQRPANFVWGIFYNYIWLAFIENMDRIRHGGSVLPPEVTIPQYQ